MKDGMHAIVLMQPMGQPTTLFVPEINLDVMQGLVGGMIEKVPPVGALSKLEKADVDLWCNEEGRLHGLKPNFWLVMSKGRAGHMELIVGPVFAASSNDDGATLGLTGEQHRLVLEVLGSLRP